MSLIKSFKIVRTSYYYLIRDINCHTKKEDALTHKHNTGPADF